MSEGALMTRTTTLKLLVFALSGLAALLVSMTATPAQAEPAIYEGKFTCAAKYPGTKTDAVLRSCWSCPSSHPKRTVFAVDTDKACEKPAGIRWSKAKDRGKGTGLLGTDCPKGAFLDIGKRRCYSCPSRYGRSIEHSVTSSKACFQRYGASRKAALIEGYEGCPDDSFRNGLTDSCYSCPAGSYRNANIADDLTSINACTRCGQEGARPCPVTTLRRSCDDFLAQDFIKNECVMTDVGRVHKAAVERLDRYFSTFVGKIGEAFALSEDPQVAQSLQAGDTRSVKARTGANRRADFNPCILDEFNTWTLGGNAGTAFIVGVGGETGVAVDVSPEGRRGSQRPAYWYADASYSLGLDGSTSMGLNYGCWTAQNNDILGTSHGIVFSLSDLLGMGKYAERFKEIRDASDFRTLKPGADLAIGIWFGYDGAITDDDVPDFLQVETGVGEFQGISITPSVGQGATFGPIYVRGYTGQFPGEQPGEGTTRTGGIFGETVDDRVFSQFYFVDESGDRNEFRMVTNDIMDVRRHNPGQSPGQWGRHRRSNHYQFYSSNAPSLYQINDDGTLTWKSNDKRNIVVTLRER